MSETDKTPAPSFGEAVSKLAQTIRQALKPRPLVFEPVEPGGEGVVYLLPSRGYADDAGLDLYVRHDAVIPPHEFADIASGVKVDIPDGLWAMITGRSSTLRKKGLLVNPGVIDAGWTGELFAGVQNLTDRPVEIAAGDRLAQLILLPAPVTGYDPQWGRVRDKERGERGFGSTGN